MSRAVSIAVVAALLSVVSGAQEKPAVWEGIVADAMCAKRWRGDEDLPSARKHTRDCAFHEACQKSGFGIFTAGQFIPFTKETNALALEFLKRSKKKNDLFVRVTGHKAGNELRLLTIEDRR